MPEPIITLLTDYGISDHYVANLRGVILGIVPQANVLDVTHQIEPQCVHSAAYVLACSAPFFPAGTVHLCVVDPGVGGSRRILAGRWAEQLIVAPDNGLISLIQQRHPAQELYEVTESNYFLDVVSKTFHGRDVMAPIAAHLAAGVPLSAVGKSMDDAILLDLPRPSGRAGAFDGQIIHIDHFGNLITNFTRQHLAPDQHVVFKDQHIRIAETFSDAPNQQPIAYEGSGQLLEIAINCGDASDVFDASIGDPVVLTTARVTDQ